MKNKCLICTEPLEEKTDYHKKCATRFFGITDVPTIPYSFYEMSELAKKAVERSVTVPGVQAKLSMSLFKDKNSHSRLTVVGALGGNYILKPPTIDYVQMPENEHLTMRLAALFGIKTVPSALIRLASGELAYITKRIDRKKDHSKIHMLDLFQITEAYDKYRSSMEKIGKALEKYSSNTLLDKISFFEMTVFNFLTGNNDMHLKNFSMIKESYGWSLAPAYDLLNVTILLPEDNEEIALTIAGKKKKITREVFINFGLGLGMNSKQIAGVFNRFNIKKKDAAQLIKQSFLSNEMQIKYLEVLEERFSRIQPLTSQYKT